MTWVIAGSLVALAFLIAAALFSPPEWLLRCSTFAPRHVDFGFSTTDRLVALTVDDGPSEDAADGLLDVLQQHGAHATFFPWSAAASGQPEFMRRLVSEGHELGNHLTGERACWDIPLEEFSQELLDADRVLREFGGPIRWFRPPGAMATSAQYREIVGWGYRPVLGNVYPYDARIPSVNFAFAFVLWNVRPGAVIVLHDGPGRGARTVRLLQRLLPALGRRGYRIVTLTDLAKHCTKS